MTEVSEAPWRRLSPLMLLISPIRSLVQSWPALVALVATSVARGDGWISLAGAVVLAALGVLRWCTTTFRVGVANLELRRGFVRRTTLTLPRQRIRSIELEAKLLHQLFGLAVVRVSSGHQSNSAVQDIVLDALRKPQAAQLREELFGGDRSSAAQERSSEVELAQVLARWSPAWLWYAPLSGTGFAMIGAGVFAVWRIVDQKAISREGEALVSAGGALHGWGIVVGAAVGVLFFVVAASALAALRSALTYGGLVVTRDEQALHVRQGLTDRKERVFDLDRLRGATLVEPLMVRAFGGAQLDVAVVGVAASRSGLLPSCPVGTARSVLGKALAADDPARMTLRRHGWAATRRRWVRALAAPALSWALLVAARSAVSWEAWTAASVFTAAMTVLAWDRSRSLGHAVGARWLVTRSGSFGRESDFLATAGIIGWTLRQNFFQRRARVATLVAATAAGKRGYEIVDVPEALAWSVAATASSWVAGSVWAHGGPARSGRSSSGPAPCPAYSVDSTGV